MGTRHMPTHSDSRNKEIHICNICGKEVTLSRSRNIHEMSHLGQFLYHCEECNKGFNEKSVLEKHKVKKHGGSYSHFCDTCGQGFMLGRSLNAHLGNCGKKKPKKKPNLSTHRCTVCEKIFNRKCNLERHMKMHNGEKDYSCHNVERSLPITEAFQITPIRNMNLKMLNYSHSDKLGVKSNENKMYNEPIQK